MSQTAKAQELADRPYWDRSNNSPNSPVYFLQENSLKPEINVSKGFLVRKSSSTFLNSSARDPTGQDSGCGTAWRLSW